MKRFVDELHHPRLYTAVAVFVYFSFIGHPSTHAKATPFGVADGNCGVEGSCMPHPQWVCILNDMYNDKCHHDGAGGCAY